MESPAVPARQRWRDGERSWTSTGPGVIQHIWMVEGFEPGSCPTVLLGQRGNALDRSPRAGLFRGWPEEVARVNSAVVVVNPQNALPTATGQCRSENHVKVTFAKRPGRRGPRVGCIPDHLTQTKTVWGPKKPVPACQWRRDRTMNQPLHHSSTACAERPLRRTFLAWTQFSKDGS